MDWLEQLKKSKLFRAVAWIAGTVIALGAVAGAINSLIELFNHDWLDGAGGWYATATSWLSMEMSIPVWLGLLTMVLLSAFLLKSAAYALREFKIELTLEEPIAEQRLTPDQQRLLGVIASHLEARNHPSFQDLQGSTGFSRLITEGAIDVLADQGLILWEEDRWGILKARLTAKGRAYLLSPEASSEYWNQGNHQA